MDRSVDLQVVQRAVQGAKISRPTTRRASITEKYKSGQTKTEAHGESKNQNELEDFRFTLQTQCQREGDTKKMAEALELNPVEHQIKSSGSRFVEEGST